MSFVAAQSSSRWLATIVVGLTIVSHFQTAFGQKKYKDFHRDSPQTWSQAENVCKAESPSSHLASCSDAEECKALQDKCNDVLNMYNVDETDASAACWIGLQAISQGTSGVADAYMWSDGSDYEISPWAPGYPMATTNNLPSCGFMRHLSRSPSGNAEFQAFNMACNSTAKFFVCTDLSTPKPTTSTQAPVATSNAPPLVPATTSTSAVPTPAPSPTSTRAPTSTPTRAPTRAPTRVDVVTDRPAATTTTVNWSPAPTQAYTGLTEDARGSAAETTSVTTIALLALVCVLSVCLCVSFWLGWKAHKYKQVKELRDWNNYLESRSSVSRTNNTTRAKFLSEVSTGDGSSSMRSSVLHSTLHSTVFSTQQSSSATIPLATVFSTPAAVAQPPPAAPPLVSGVSMSTVNLKNSSRRGSDSSVSATRVSDDDDDFRGFTTPSRHSSRDLSPSSPPLGRGSVSQQQKTPPNKPQAKRLSITRSLGRFESFKNTVLARSRSRKFERKKLPFQLKNAEGTRANSSGNNSSRGASDSDQEGSIRARSDSEDSISLSFSADPTKLALDAGGATGELSRTSAFATGSVRGTQKLVALPPTARRRLARGASVAGSQATNSPSLSAMSSLLGTNHRRKSLHNVTATAPAGDDDDDDAGVGMRSNSAQLTEVHDFAEIDVEDQGDDEVGALEVVPVSPASVDSSPPFFGVESGTPLPQFSLNSRDDGKKHHGFDSGSSMSPFTRSLVNRLGGGAGGRTPSPRIATPLAGSPATFNTANSVADAASLLPTSYSDPFNSSVRLTRSSNSRKGAGANGGGNSSKGAGGGKKDNPFDTDTDPFDA